MEGCWECGSFPCSNGRFLDENRGQTLGFLQFIKKYGKEGFVNKLLSNQNKGIKYGMKGAYRHKSLEEVEELLEDQSY